jgi:excisionase family DNA binding protein
MAWLKMGKACKYLDVCRDTMRKLIRKNLIIAEKDPESKHWRIDEDSLKSYFGQPVDNFALEHVRKHGL